jgi:hypothetical protein
VQNDFGVASADTLTDRMDALADALRAAGVAPERVASILASAATATMHALVLDGVLDSNAAAAKAQARPPEQQPAAGPLKRAA